MNDDYDTLVASLLLIGVALFLFGLIVLSVLR
jgi:hypothetical protein